ncbi:MAG: FAD-binding oxidoreductase [Flavobacteriales bacterium]|nr:flavodoxin reductase [Flavobacteriales bacterium]
MEPLIAEVKSTSFITPDVKRFVLTRPKGLKFKPGQGVMVAIDRDGWRDEWRPFTFTSLTTSRTIELIIKIYDGRKGVTEQMGILHKGDKLLLGDVFGTITYNGPGVFFAAGTGITPFLSIFRDLNKKKKMKGISLVYSNRTGLDVIMDEELTKLLGSRYYKLFTRERVIGFRDRRIDRDTLIALVQDFDQHFYICGPKTFVHDLEIMLLSLGAKADTLIFES